MVLFRQDEIRRKRQHVYHIVLGIFAIILSGVIIWIDIHTGFWGDTVIVSGLAAGLLMYLATVFIGDRITHKSEVENWLPLTRLALANILHTMTDDDLSEGVDGKMVPRSITLPDQLNDSSIDQLSQEVVQERNEIATTVSRWAAYLAANADVQDLILKIADNGSELDDIRLAINGWRAANPNDRTQAEVRLHKEVNDYNELIADTVTGLQRMLHELRGDDDS